MTGKIADWFLDAGSWIVLTLSTALGIIGTGFVMMHDTKINHLRIVIQAAMAVITAVILVSHDYRHGDPKRKRERIVPRIARMFSSGCASIIVPAAGYELVKIVAKWFVMEVWK